MNFDLFMPLKHQQMRDCSHKPENIFLENFDRLNWEELKQREYLFNRHQVEVLEYRVGHFQ
jgi:hypothetical protein